MKVKPKILFPLITALVATGMMFWFSIPSSLFRAPCCTVIEDRNGWLLGARIASDGEWRFPAGEIIPEKYKKAVIEFEDRRFYRHFGVDPVAFCRAVFRNIRAGQVVQGGSTLTMQVIRMSRNGKSRTFSEKIIEMIMALRLELTFSKDEIFRFYAGNAPFGGNIVGIDAASWKYFGRDPGELSWAEASLLAVLPNSPSMLFPGRNQQKLVDKRNRLLARLYERNMIDSLTWSLSLIEPLPVMPSGIEQVAPHLLTRMGKERPGEKTRTTIDYTLQKQVNGIVGYHHQKLMYNNIRNAAALILEVRTGNVLAYVGNTDIKDDPGSGSDVDIILSPRSSGSILKPILYAAMLDRGEILQDMLVPDIPTVIAGFAPENFNKTYSGAVPARLALSRSLNVPAVRMLREFDVARFLNLLQRLGLKSLDQSPGHYGLSLILGGGEVTLWELAGVYAGFSRVLDHYTEYEGKYNIDDWREPFLVKGESDNFSVRHPKTGKETPLRASSVWLTYEALAEVNRPDEFAVGDHILPIGKVAWKTGTSYGFRDGWAVGTTREYLVAVWVGNAGGEGRSGLTGSGTAAPILFDIFNILPSSSWFDCPYDEMIRVPVCRLSGHRASGWCEPVDTVWIPEAGLVTEVCPYHRMIHLDPSGQYRVSSSCCAPSAIRQEHWFVLPPVMEAYYKSGNPVYRTLPPFQPGCETGERNPIALVYPGDHARIFLPRQLDGKPGHIVFKAAHHDPGAVVFWHLDDQFAGRTTLVHQLPLQPKPGKHRLTLVDGLGNELIEEIEVFLGY